MFEYENIVIIGASCAGTQLANQLVPNLPGTHRILLIDALGFSFYTIASLRAAVVPGWEKRVTVPLKKEHVFAAGSAHELIAPNKVVELKGSSVVLEKPFEGSTEIPFFKCIIATGAQQPSPMRPQPDTTEDEYRQTLVKYQQEIGKASKVVIVGAGSVGLEVAGEIRAKHADTSITIVHSLPQVLNPTANPPGLNDVKASWSSPPTAPKLSIALEKELNALDINLITGDKVNIPASGGGPGDWDGSFGMQSSMKSVGLESGKKIEADFVFVSVGNSPNTSLVEKLDKGAISGGLIAVDEYLRVTSTTASSPLIGKYYAIGDCCSTPGWKNWQGAVTDGTASAVNVLAEIKNTPIKAYKRPLPIANFIPLGPNNGQGTLSLPYLGQVMVPKFLVKSAKGQKLLVEDLFFARYQGSEKLQAPPASA